MRFTGGGLFFDIDRIGAQVHSSIAELDFKQGVFIVS